MNFGEAIKALQCGNRVRRAGWYNSRNFLGLQQPDPGSANTLPYIYMVIKPKDDAGWQRVPWLASQTDMLAEDWHLSDPMGHSLGEIKENECAAEAAQETADEEGCSSDLYDDGHSDGYAAGYADGYGDGYNRRPFDNLRKRASQHPLP